MYLNIVLFPTEELLLYAGTCVYPRLPIVFRYAGYCPQLKYNMGKSYGQLTGELLTSPEVKHSSRLVLHTGHDPSTESDAGLTPRGIPDSNLKQMIPGYTGRYHTLSNLTPHGKMISYWRQNVGHI